MSSASKSLSGDWTGVYDYPEEADGHDDLKPTPFNASIIEEDGTISGQIVEPDLIEQLSQDVFADLVGQRNGSEVFFTKTYEALVSEYLGVVEYHGMVNDSLTEIKGYWMTVEEEPWSGPFVMNRKSAAKQELSLTAKEDIDVF